MKYITFFGILFLFLFPMRVHGDSASEITAKQQQIEEIQRQIDEYQSQANAVGQVSQTLQGEINRLNAQVNQITLQIRQLSASLDQTGLQIKETSGDIEEAEQKIALHQSALAEYIQVTAENDQQSLTEILLKNNALSDFFDYVHSVQRSQDSLRLAIHSISELRDMLDQRRDDLEGKQQDLERIKGLQEIAQNDLAYTKSTKNKILKETKGQESKFQQLVKEGKQNLERLKQEISYLQQSGITVDDAVKYAKLAAIGAGIRPAFLLALLEVESRLGLNVGKGNWQDDMYLCYMRLSKLAQTADRRNYYIKRAETEKSAFLKITSSLGLDPNALKVSKEPSYGCGGAMGPAQFIPSTWLSYASEVTRLTGRSVANPWNTQDAFTAAGIKLARGGASSQTRAGELAAAKAYISGNPNCSKAICNSYSNTILQKAAQIERDL